MANQTKTNSLSGIILLLTLSVATVAQAQDFAELGVGTQVVVINGEDGSDAGVGLNARVRLLWVLGFDISATSVAGPQSEWAASTYRANVLLHAINTDYFGLYLAPGMSGEDLSDTFNPNGASTWYRLGGGMEFRYEGFALGGEVHWAIPGIHRTDAAIRESVETAVVQSVQTEIDDASSGYGFPTMGQTAADEIMTDYSTNDLLDVLPLERIEVSVGLRYYF